MKATRAGIAGLIAILALLVAVATSVLAAVPCTLQDCVHHSGLPRA